MPTARATT